MIKKYLGIALSLLLTTQLQAGEVLNCHTHKVEPKPIVAPVVEPDAFDKARSYYHELHDKIFPPTPAPKLPLSDDQLKSFGRGFPAMFDEHSYLIKNINGDYSKTPYLSLKIDSSENNDPLSVVSRDINALVLSHMFTFQLPGKPLDTFITTYTFERNGGKMTEITTVDNAILNTFVGACVSSYD